MEQRSIRAYMDTNSNDQNGEDAKIYDGVNQNRDATRAHVSTFHRPRPRRNLNQEPRR